MKNLLKKYLPFLVIFVLFATTTYAASIFKVQQGGTGVGTLASGECLLGNGTGPIQTAPCGSVIAEPDTEVVFGTGAGITTSSDFTFNPTGDFSVTAAADATIAANGVVNIRGVNNGTTISLNDSGQLVDFIGGSIFSPFTLGEVNFANNSVMWGDVNLVGNGTYFLVSDVGQDYTFSKGNFNINSVPYVWPSSQATTFGDYLSNDASGNLSWIALPTPIFDLIHTDSIASTIVGAGAGTGSSGESFYAGVNAGSGATVSPQSNFIGFGAGQTASNAGQSNFIGKDAGSGATNAGGSNFLGTGAGSGATDANSSTFIGGLTGAGALNATDSIFIGTSAGNTATNAANSIFIGAGAGDTDAVNNTGSADDSSILLGNYINTGGHSNSIIIGSGSIGSPVSNSLSNQFMVPASYVNWQIAGINYVMPSSLGSAGSVLTDVAGDGVLSWAAGGGSPVNIYNSDGTLTGTRTVNGGNNDLSWNSMGAFTIATIDKFDVAAGDAEFIVNNNADIKLSTGSGAGVFRLFNSGAATLTLSSGLTVTGSATPTGTSGQVLTSNGASSSPTWQTPPGGSPGGLNTQIQYNNSGVFGGISGAVTDGTSVSLTGAHLLSPTINGAGVGLATLAYPNTALSATITFPTTTDTLATLAGTEALTNKSVNGVTLTTGGSATAFLNGAGSYTTPAGTVYTGTTNRLTVTGTVLDIAATYVGQSSITTLGTITTGIWNATAISNVKGGTGIDTSASTGIAQVSGGSWSVSTALANGTTATTQTAADNSTKVATTAYVDSATGGFLPIAGRTYTTTTGNGLALTTSTLTTGNLVSLASTGTAAGSNTQTVLNIATSGANGTSTQSTWGLDISNTHTGTSSTNIGMRLTASGGTNNYALITNGGLVGIGNTTPTAQLDVADTTLAGSGSLAGSALNIAQTFNTSGAPIAMKVNVTNTAAGTASRIASFQVGGKSALGVLLSGSTQLGTDVSVGLGPVNSNTGSANIDGDALRFFSHATNFANSYNFWFLAASNQTQTSGTNGGINYATTFAPTSGTGTFSQFLLAPTINQTGGASGITRGLYINPTITAAADFRALEVANGKTLLGGALTVTGTTTLATSLTGPLRADAGVVSVDATLVAGTYTPTATNVTNITSSTPNVTSYSRVGNVVTEAGTITVTNTLAVASEVDVSLGVASNLAATTDLNGTATMDSTASVNMYIKGDATNDRASIFFTSAGVGQTSTIYYSFQYKVI